MENDFNGRFIIIFMPVELRSKNGRVWLKPPQDTVVRVQGSKEGTFVIEGRKNNRVKLGVVLTEDDQPVDWVTEGGVFIGRGGLILDPQSGTVLLGQGDLHPYSQSLELRINNGNGGYTKKFSEWPEGTMVIRAFKPERLKKVKRRRRRDRG